MNCCLPYKLRIALASVLLPATLLVGCMTSAPVSSAEPVPAPSTTRAPTTSGENGEMSPAAATSEVGEQTQQDEQVSAGMGEEELAPIVSAAIDFIGLLDAQQKEAALLPFDSNKRPNWSNLPAGMLPFDRNGVRIGDLSDNQLAAMLAFLSTTMSPAGLETVTAIVAAEAVLSESQNAGRLGWSEGNYWLAFFGTPSPTEPWAWQFGGHHLAVNMSISDGRITMSPAFIGVEPSVIDEAAVDEIFATLGGDRASAGKGTVAPFADEIEAGLALVNGLSAAARDAALVSRRPNGLLTGAGQDGVIPELQGSQASSWGSGQQQALLDLVSLWVGMLPPRNARLRMDEIESNLNDTYFAWHGPTDGAGAIYFRIQGPDLIIEFLTRGPVGANNGHYHSIYRDPTNEYGQH